MLHLPGGVTLGVDVRNLLELESSFKGNWEVDAAAQVKEVARGGEVFSQLLALGGAGAKYLFNLGGDTAQLFDQCDRPGRVEPATQLT